MENGKRRSIKKKEVDCLELIYRFRFVTAGLLVDYGFTNDTSNSRRQLDRLVELGLIGKRYDKSYKIERRPASYYLLSAGVKVLRYAKRDLASEATHLIHRDPTASEKFVSHSHGVLRVAARLTKIYKEDSKYLSKAELYGFDAAIRPLPDGFFRLTDNAINFYIEVVDAAAPAFAIGKRVKQYIEDAELEEWEAQGGRYPVILIIAGSEPQLHRLQKTIYKSIESQDSDLNVYGASIDRFNNEFDTQYKFRNLTSFGSSPMTLQEIAKSLN